MKILLKAISLIFICSIAIFGCDSSSENSDNPDDSKYNQIDFTVSYGSSSVSKSWPAEYQNIGFSYSYSGSCYYNIFKAADGYESENLNFYNYMFIYIPYKTIGKYSSSDGITDISYYDQYASEYKIYDDYSGTHVNIEIISVTNGFIHGTFEGVVYSIPENKYLSIKGTIDSY